MVSRSTPVRSGRTPWVPLSRASACSASAVASVRVRPAGTGSRRPRRDRASVRGRFFAAEGAFARATPSLRRTPLPSPLCSLPQDRGRERLANGGPDRRNRRLRRCADRSEFPARMNRDRTRASDVAAKYGERTCREGRRWCGRRCRCRESFQGVFALGRAGDRRLETSGQRVDDGLHRRGEGVRPAAQRLDMSSSDAAAPGPHVARRQFGHVRVGGDQAFEVAARVGVDDLEGRQKERRPPEAVPSLGPMRRPCAALRPCPPRREGDEPFAVKGGSGDCHVGNVWKVPSYG